MTRRIRATRISVSAPDSLSEVRDCVDDERMPKRAESLSKEWTESAMPTTAIQRAQYINLCVASMTRISEDAESPLEAFAPTAPPRPRKHVAQSRQSFYTAFEAGVYATSACLVCAKPARPMEVNAFALRNMAVLCRECLPATT